jgi:hypothetical protein
VHLDRRSVLGSNLAARHPTPFVRLRTWLAAHGERELGARRVVVGGESAGVPAAAQARRRMVAFVDRVLS